MKSTLAVALSLAINFTFIVCLPSHGYLRNSHPYQRISRTVATHSLIPNSDMFFIKRSLSPLENPESSSDAKLVARAHEDEPEDCDDEDQEDDDSYDSSSGNVTSTAQTSAATEIPKPEAAHSKSSAPTPTHTSTVSAPAATDTPKPEAAHAKPSAPTPTYTSTASASAPTDSTSSGASVSVGLEISSSSGSSYTSSSSYSSESYSGKATFFYQGGVAGSCGIVHSDSDYVVAIPTAMYGGGKFCGKSIVVTRPSTGKSVTCIGADKCPGCPSSGSLDMSTGAFNALGDPDEGVFDISWSVV